MITPAGELSVYKLASAVGKNFESVSEYLHILEEAGLVRFLFPYKSSKAQLRNPTKIFPDNTNIIQYTALPNQHDNMRGKVRETFFVSQCQNAGYKIYYSKQGDFIVNDTIFEIGSKNKTTQQIRDLDNAYIVADGVLVGSKRFIPLYLFGLLY